MCACVVCVHDFVCACVKFEKKIEKAVRECSEYLHTKGHRYITSINSV